MELVHMQTRRSTTAMATPAATNDLLVDFI